jgi:hypothetical protein
MEISLNNFILQTTPGNNKRPRHFWCCRQLSQFSRFVMETMHQRLHGRCSLSVGKPERIRGSGQVKEPWNCFIQCFLQRETLISKSVVSDVQKLLDETIKVANYIKSRQLQSRLCSALCCAMEAAHTLLLLLYRGAWFQGSLNWGKSLRNFVHVWRVWAGWPA